MLLKNIYDTKRPNKVVRHSDQYIILVFCIIYTEGFMALNPDCHASSPIPSTHRPLLGHHSKLTQQQRKACPVNFNPVSWIRLLGCRWSHSCHSTSKSWGAFSAEARIWLMEDFLFWFSNKSWMKSEELSRSAFPRDSCSFAVDFGTFLLGSARPKLEAFPAGLSSLQE